MENQNQNTQNQPAQLHKRQFKPFWPIVIICTLSFLVGGLIVWIAYNQGLDDQIYSLLPGKLITHKTNELRQASLPEGEGVDISSWQTYVNKEYGFEFKYPKEWEKNQEPCYTEKACIADIFEIWDENRSKVIRLDHYDNVLPTDFSSVGAFTKWYGENVKGNEINKAEIISDDGLRVIRTLEVDGINSEGTYIYIPHNNFFIVLSTNNSRDLDRKANDALVKILSTFKFTQQ